LGEQQFSIYEGVLEEINKNFADFNKSINESKKNEQRKVFESFVLDPQVILACYLCLLG